jgi:hypothetical protein
MPVRLHLIQHGAVRHTGPRASHDDQRDQCDESANLDGLVGPLSAHGAHQLSGGPDHGA